MHIVAEEKPVAREARKNPSAHHPRSLGVDVNLNIRPASHPPVNISQRCAPPDLPYVPHGAQGNFTPSPRPKPRHPTAEHGSDVPEDSAHSDSVVQGTGRQRYKDEAPGLDEQRVLRRARDTDSSSSSGSHPIADQVFLVVSRHGTCNDLGRLLGTRLASTLNKSTGLNEVLKTEHIAYTLYGVLFSPLKYFNLVVQ